VRAFDRGTDVLDRVLRRMAAFFRLAARSEAADAELDGAVGGTARQGLRIGVGADELDAACTLRSIMCSTALPPPPPTPITLIWVPRLNSSTSIISMVMCVSPDFCSCLNAGVSMLLFLVFAS
jgi:hypothetical protein